FSPKEEDYQAIRHLLVLLLNGICFNVSGLADHLVQNNWVGSCIKCEGADDCFGVISCVNLTTSRSLDFLDSIKCSILSQVRGTTTYAADQLGFLEQLLSGSLGDIGFIINQRLESVPPILSPHLHEHLFQEVHQAALEEAGDAPADRHFQFKFFLTF